MIQHESYDEEDPKKSTYLRFCDKFSMPRDFVEDILLENNVFLSNSYENVFLNYKKEADKGDPNSQYQTGDCYENGNGVFQSFVKAFKYYNLAAEQGHSKAQQCLGFLYQNGRGVRKSLEQAFKYYKQSADQNNARALYFLGTCFEQGIGTKKSPEQAFKYYYQSAIQEDILGLEGLASAYKYGIGVEISLEKAQFYYEKMLSRLEKLAMKGDAEALIKLGQKYLDKDISNKKAIYYFKLAAKMGIPLGFYCLAECYARKMDIKALSKKEIEEYRQKSFKYYSILCERGFSAAQHAFAIRLFDYLNAYPEKTYDEENARYLELLLKEKFEEDYSDYNANKNFYIAECYEKGYGIVQSDEKALHFYELAEKNGSVEALCKLRDIYLKGTQKFSQLGTQYLELDNYSEAIRYFEKGTQRIDGQPLDTECLYELAKCYEEGKGVDKSLEKSFVYSMLYCKATKPKRLLYRFLYSDLKNQAFDYLKSIVDDNFELKEVREIVAFCLRYGIGTEKNISAASNYEIVPTTHKMEEDLYQIALKYDSYVLYKWAASLGHIEAQYLCKTDLDQDSIMYMEQAAQQGHVKAQYEIGKHYIESSKNKNIEKGIQYLLQASYAGNSDAMHALGGYYENKKPRIAYKYYRQAAMIGNKEAQKAVSRCYEYGIGVFKSMKRCLYFYELAAQQGDELAQDMLQMYVRDPESTDGYQYVG